MKKGILFLMAIFIGLGLMAQSQYKVDPMHSSVNFKVKHTGITFVSGKFEKFDGEITGNMDKMEEAQVSFNVEMTSINTSVPMRDDHLRSADFFEVEKYPSMSFKSTSIEKVDDKNYKLKGKLQIKDVTKDVTFDVVYGGLITGNDSTKTVGFIAKNKIDRTDYNVSYNPDGSQIGKDVYITLYLEFKSVK